MQTTTQITIRTLDERDLTEVRRLAQRDSAPAPGLPLLGAELDGRLIAAVSVVDGDATPVSDPFVATFEAVTLLQLRAAQLRGHEGTHRRRLRDWRPRRRTRARGAIAGSPPGGAGQLLRL